jgi:hypothetical protein
VIVRVVVVVAIVVATVIAVLASGWADDRPPAGSKAARR